MWCWCDVARCDVMLRDLVWYDVVGCEVGWSEVRWGEMRLGLWFPGGRPPWELWGYAGSLQSDYTGVMAPESIKVVSHRYLKPVRVVDSWLNKMRHHDRGTVPWERISLFNDKCAGAGFNTSAVRPTSSPHLRLLNRSTARPSCAKLYNGSARTFGFSKCSIGPANKASTMDAKISSWGCTTTCCPVGRGKKIRKSFHLEVVPRNIWSWLVFQARTSRQWRFRICKLHIFHKRVSVVCFRSAHRCFNRMAGWKHIVWWFFRPYFWAAWIKICSNVSALARLVVCNSCRIWLWYCVGASSQSSCGR